MFSGLDMYTLTVQVHSQLVLSLVNCSWTFQQPLPPTPSPSHCQNIATFSDCLPSLNNRVVSETGNQRGTLHVNVLKIEVLKCHFPKDLESFWMEDLKIFKTCFPVYKLLGWRKKLRSQNIDFIKQKLSNNQQASN